MSFWDKVLRLLGTNRIRLGWRWRTIKESWNRPRSERRGSSGGIVPDDFPIVTAVIIGVCVLFYFLAVKMTGDLTGETETEPALPVLFRYGATFPDAVIRSHEWWRTVSSVFLHGGLLHIVMNMIALWSIGPVTEDRFGRARTLVVFVITGAVGMAASVLWHAGEFSVGVGASGALFGLMGCVIVHAWRQGGRASALELRARFIPWMLFGLIIGFASSNIDNAAHLGGLVSGGLLGLFLGERAVARRVRWVWEILAAAAIVAVAFAFYAAARSPLVSG